MGTNAFDFNTQLRRLTTPAACRDFFRSVVAPLGFDAFACGELDLNHRDRSAFYVIDWPAAWRRFYIETGLIDDDPIVDGLARHREPFTWSDLRRSRKLTKVGRAVLDAAAAHGWTEGLVVPSSRGRGRIGLVSLVGRRDGLTLQARAYLSLVSLCFHSHVRSLVITKGFAAPPAGLTGREIECIRLVARGFSDNAVAKSLEIAPSTAHEFIEKAKRRLKTRSRVEMVAVAVCLGIVDA